jgi:SAM-dependent methyltransferase
MTDLAPRGGPAGKLTVDSGRLLYFERPADAGYWDEVWQRELRPGFFDEFHAGNLKWFHKPFLRYLPPKGLVLEAGCGTGQWVVALNARGFRCMGLDYARGTLRRVRSELRDSLFIAGDLLNLCVRDRSLDAVISLGVVEHRREGPGPFFEESHRILRPGGVLLISVPFFNRVRQRRFREELKSEELHDLEFYQYAFRESEFAAFLDAAGFNVLETWPYDHMKCLRQVYPWISRLPLALQKVVGRLSAWVPMLRSQGHMLLYVARKRL